MKMSKLRLLIACSFQPSPHSWGGGAIVARQLIDFLVRSRVEVGILTRTREDRLNVLDGVAMRFAMASLNELLDVYDPWGELLLKSVKDFAPDVAYIHNLHDGFSLRFVKKLRRMGIPCVAMFHDLWPLCARYNLAEEGWKLCRAPSFIKCLRCRRDIPHQLRLPGRHVVIREFLKRYLNKIVVPSRFAKKCLINAGYPEEIIKVIPNGVDPGLFKPPSGKSKLFTVLYVGRPSYKKGVFHLIKACAKLVRKKQELELMIVGGPIYERLKIYASKLGFIKLTGVLPYSNLPAMYQRAHVYVQPSLIHDNFPLTVLEALASANPIIAARVGGLREQVGRAGFLVKPGDVNELANAIEILYSNEDLRKRLAIEARRRAEVFFDIKKTAKMHLRVLEELAMT